MDPREISSEQSTAGLSAPASSGAPTASAAPLAPLAPSAPLASTPSVPSPLEYFTPEEVAAKLKVTPETVQRWLRTGLLGGFKLGGKGWRVTTLDISAMVAAGTATAEAPPTTTTSEATTSEATTTTTPEEGEGR